MSFNPPKSAHETSVEHLLYAIEAAHKGDHEKTHTHIDHSKRYAEMQARRLRALGRKDDADKHIQEHAVHVQAVKTMLENAIKNKTQKSDKEIDLIKGFGSAPLPQVSSMNIIGGTRVKPSTEPFPAKMGEVSKNPRHEYKKFHELSPEHQQTAHSTFGGKDMTNYEYATRPGTGEFVGGQRIPIQSSKQAAPKPSQTYAKIAPSLNPGTAVRIESTNLAHHGKFGIVATAHPYYPGKTAVQIKPNHTIFVDAHEAKPTNPSNRIEKAMISLYNIRKAFVR